MMLSHFRGELLISWIPAFAGMTQFWLMDNLGLSVMIAIALQWAALKGEELAERCTSFRRR